MGQTIDPELHLADWQQRIRGQRVSQTPLQIQGGGSKAFYGNSLEDSVDVIDTRSFTGIVTYDEAELILTARAGTSITEIEHALKDNCQMLPFEPPHFAPGSTLGGCVAAGLSGPRRPFAGAVRDHVLGVRLIDGRGDRLKFGAEVIKNVAGFDVSRLMVGAMGTLGLITEISIKVVPLPRQDATLVLQRTSSEVLETLNTLRRQSWPVSGTAFIDNQLFVRFSGSENVVRVAVRAAMTLFGGAELAGLAQADDFWRSLRNQTNAWFNAEGDSLWRLSVRLDAPFNDFNGAPQIIEWSGALRWVRIPVAAGTTLREWALHHGGHATLFKLSRQDKRQAGGIERFAALSSQVISLHHQLKQTFDPDGIFNPGRLYHAL